MGSPLSILHYHQPVEFRIGEVIVRSWNILSRHFLTFILLVGIAELLPLVVNLYLGREDEVIPAGWQAGLAVYGSRFLGFVLSTFAQAIVVYAAFQDLRGRQPNAAESFRQGVGRVLPVIVASVLAGLVVAVGFILCIIPGLIALTAMAVVVPACVVEQLGPIDAMSRSADLTSGHRWPILAVGVAWLVIVLVVGASISASMRSTTGLPTQLTEWVWEVLSTSYTSVYAAILYHDLRAVREGIGIDEIASLFD
jgi:hypothetical protein